MLVSPTSLPTTTGVPPTADATLPSTDNTLSVPAVPRVAERPCLPLELAAGLTGSPLGAPTPPVALPMAQPSAASDTYLRGENISAASIAGLNPGRPSPRPTAQPPTHLALGTAGPQAAAAAATLQDDSLKEEFGIGRGLVDTSALIAEFNSLRRADQEAEPPPRAQQPPPALAAAPSGSPRRTATRSSSLGPCGRDESDMRLPAIAEGKVRHHTMQLAANREAALCALPADLRLPRCGCKP